MKELKHTKNGTIICVDDYCAAIYLKSPSWDLVNKPEEKENYKSKNKKKKEESVFDLDETL